MPRDTGLPLTDAQDDFNRARRRRILSRAAARLRGEPSDLNVILPFEEVVEALGYRGERQMGVQTIDLDSIVGTVDRSREFDRSFQPTSSRTRPRFERIAKALRKGEAMPPIDVYRIGELHFVKDGHHRVAVARALGWRDIDAHVTEVETAVGAERQIRMADLPLKSHERLFYERVPLPPEARERMKPSNRSAYACLAEGVEAWGFRVMQGRGEFMTREEVAELWFREEYEPVVAMLKEAGVAGSGTETDAYMAVVTLRYLLLRTHEWDENVLNALREEMEKPSWEDTEIRRLRRALS
jgi:ParB-like nuclease domain